MRIYPDCIVCLFRLALRTARLATGDRTIQLRILKKMAAGLSELPEEKAKCSPIARELGMDQGALVLRAGRALELEMVK